MARVYATEADYLAYTGTAEADAPANLTTLLRVASGVVDHLLRARLYDVDAAGLPTDADDIAAMQDATCAIARDADAIGALAAGATGEWGSVSIGNVSLSNPLTSGGGGSVSGVPVPVEAMVALADVGTQWVFVQ